jgi:hypothetical protein
MDNIKIINTTETFKSLTQDHQGGGFIVKPSGNPPQDNLDQTAARILTSANNFTVSIYNQNQDDDVLSLFFLINPTDITVGQTFIAQDSYTREGWLSTIWGKGQPTILANGTTAAFYLNGTGLTADQRRQTISFKNFMSIVAIFKNGGYYYLRGAQNKDLFGVDRGRVISVMDLIKISYDGTEYIGSFNNLTIEETAEIPYRFTFNFEFVVSGLRGDPAEGHLKICQNGKCNNIDGIQLETSGNYNYQEIISINPNATDIVPPANTTTTSGSEIASTGNTPAAVVPTFNRSIVPANVRRDAQAYADWLQHDSGVPVRGDLDTQDKVCAKMSLINKFKNKIGADDLFNTASSYFGTGSRIQEPDSDVILALENSYYSDGTPKSLTSGAGALGPTQIMPSTYSDILDTHGTDFTAYMAKFGYSEADCTGALGTQTRISTYSGKTYPIYSGGKLSVDPKFNYATHLYLMQKNYTTKVSGSNAVAHSSDPIPRIAVVATSYNAGTAAFSNSKTDYSLANEGVVYGQTATFIASVSGNCSNSTLTP